MADTFKEIKDKAKNAAEKVTDKETYTGNEDPSDYRSDIYEITCAPFAISSI